MSGINEQFFGIRAGGRARDIQPSSVITIGSAQLTTSGTAFDFINIPSGVKQIVITFDAVSLSGTDNFLIQIGSGGALETSGYEAQSTSFSISTLVTVSSTAGFILRGAGATAELNGSLILSLHDIINNTWVANGSLGRVTTNSMIAGGAKSISGELDTLRLTRSGSDTFDSGSVNIQYLG